MKRYKITLLVPVEKEILATDSKEAVKEARRLAELYNQKTYAVVTIIRSVVFIKNEVEPIDFGFVDGDAA